MRKNYDNLFYEEIPKKNKIFQVMLFCSLIAPIVFFVGTLVKIWDIDLNYSIVLFVAIFCSASISVLLNSISKTQSLCMYFSLIAASAVVFTFQANDFINPTITLGLIPIVSCLYINKRLTLCVSIVNYLFIAVGSYFRFNDFFMAYMIGITMEFVFFTFCIIWLLRNLQKAYFEKNELLEKSEKLQENLEQEKEYLQNSQYKIIQFTGKALGQNDFYTSRHVVHTQEYVSLICKRLSKEGYYKNILTEEEIRIFSSASFLHDIGKLHIDSKILDKKNNYTEEELEIIKSHTEKGATLLELLPKIDDGHFNDIAIQMAMSHHEHWDGTGYPVGLKDTTIPLCARILAVADALDSYITESQNPATAVLDALNKIDAQSDKYFERCIVDVTVRLRFDIEHLVKQFEMQESTPSHEDMVWWALNHKF